MSQVITLEISCNGCGETIRKTIGTDYAYWAAKLLEERNWISFRRDEDDVDFCPACQATSPDKKKAARLPHEK